MRAPAAAAALLALLLCSTATAAPTGRALRQIEKRGPIVSWSATNCVGKHCNFAAEGEIEEGTRRVVDAETGEVRVERVRGVASAVVFGRDAEAFADVVIARAGGDAVGGCAGVAPADFEACCAATPFANGCPNAPTTDSLTVTSTASTESTRPRFAAAFTSATGTATSTSPGASADAQADAEAESKQDGTGENAASDAAVAVGAVTSGGANPVADAFAAALANSAPVPATGQQSALTSTYVATSIGGR